MRKRKLRGGKQDIAGAKEDDDSRTKDWKVELTAASKALALRWLRAAREGLDGEHFYRSDISCVILFLPLKNCKPLFLVQTNWNCTGMVAVVKG